MILLCCWCFILGFIGLVQVLINHGVVAELHPLAEIITSEIIIIMSLVIVSNRIKKGSGY